jgi:hypothetical protein
MGRFILLTPQIWKPRKELKPELKELKEIIAEKAQLNWENKSKIEIKELEPKGIFEKGPKELVENQGGGKLNEGLGQPGPLGDPLVLARLLAARIDDLERRLATGKAFIRPDERPHVGHRAPVQPTLSPGEKAVLDAATPPPPPRLFDDLSPVQRYTRAHDLGMKSMEKTKGKGRGKGGMGGMGGMDAPGKSVGGGKGSPAKAAASRKKSKSRKGKRKAK